MKLMPRIQRITSGLSQRVTSVPSAAAPAWLASVATRMPAAMVQGWRQRATSSSASSCVLSPISPRATTPVLTAKASRLKTGLRTRHTGTV